MKNYSKDGLQDLTSKEILNIEGGSEFSEAIAYGFGWLSAKVGTAMYVATLIGMPK